MIRRFIELPTFMDYPYIPVKLMGERQLSPVFKALLQSQASAISVETFQKLFPSLDPSNFVESFDKVSSKSWSPHVRLKLHFPKTAIGKLNLGTSAKFAVVETDVIPWKNVIYLNDNVARSLGEIIKYVDQREISEDEEKPPRFSLIYPKIWAYQADLTSLKRGVLILGNDNGEGLWRMKAIETEVNIVGLEGIIVRDYPDFHSQSIEEKMSMFAGASLFAIVEHTFPSGVIDELKICANQRIVTCVLRESGHGATWMQSDYELDYRNVKEFTYTMNPLDGNYLPRAVHEGIKWARERIRSKANMLNNAYPWRSDQIDLEEGDADAYR